MSQEQNVPKMVSEEYEEMTDAPCRCAFYQAAMPSAAQARSGQAEGNARALRHSCLLNPGKAHGPDGNRIGLSDCTLARQTQCQAQRRQAFNRLHATLRSLRVATSAAGS